jgi:hypothetical protein
MALKHRIQSLEKSYDSYRDIYAIALKSGESEDEAMRKYCTKEGIAVEEMEHRPSGSLVVFLKTDFGD